jgi:hypothetical protein
MKNNKRGLSTVVTTLIIVLLVLVAVGIIWGVVKNLLDKGSDTADSFGTCLNVDIQATKAVAWNSTTDGILNDYNMTFSRSPGGEDKEFFLKINFLDETGNSLTNKNMDVALTPFSTSSDTFTDIGTTDNEVYKIEMLPYYLDDSGNDALCSITSEYIL